MAARRYQELDTLRGIAALIVLIHHAFLLAPGLQKASSAGTGNFSTSDLAVRVLTYSPIHVFWAGYEAVIVFFVLSGFVLANSMETGNRRVGPFLVKRFFRIYPAYLISVLAALALRRIMPPMPTGYSDWAAGVWSGSPDVWGHVLLLGNFNAGQLNPVLWSLVIEARLSILFPLLLILVEKRGVIVSLVASFALMVLCIVAGRRAPNSVAGWLSTGQYVIAFVAGISLQRKKDDAVAAFRRLHVSGRVVLLALAATLFVWTWWPFHGLKLIVNAVTINAAAIVAASVFISACLSFPAFSVLRSRLAIYLGTVSYSFYLLHALIMISLAHVTGAPPWALGMLTVPLALLVATLVYRCVEIPGIRLGRWFVSRSRAA